MQNYPAYRPVLEHPGHYLVLGRASSGTCKEEEHKRRIPGRGEGDKKMHRVSRMLSLSITHSGLGDWGEIKNSRLEATTDYEMMPFFFFFLGGCSC